MEKKKIGLIKGGGTGPELVEIFKRVSSELVKIPGQTCDIEFIECPHQFKTYNEVRNSPGNSIKRTVETDLEKIRGFLKEFYREGGRLVFRTAMNAETLYIFRRDAMVQKTIHLKVNNNNVLVIRDESQGFYTNDNYSVEGDKLTFSGSFSKEKMEASVRFAELEAAKSLKRPFDVWLVYKHHLFLNVIESWAKDILPSLKVCQPNHATELFFEYINKKNQKDLLIIMGNETGDILHEVFIYVLNMGTRKSLCSREVCLHPDVKNLDIYQTVHGSVDDLAGKDIVNPLATIRAAAALVAQIFPHGGILDVVEKSIKKIIKKSLITPDMGGKYRTTEVVDGFIKAIRGIKNEREGEGL